MGFMGALKKIAGTVAPTVASALGTPLAGLAVSTVAKELGIETSDPKEQQKLLEEALNNPTPEQWLRLKAAEQAFEQRLKELDIDLEKIHQADRESAREREKTVKDKTPAILAFLIVFIFAGLAGGLFWLVKTDQEIPRELLVLFTSVFSIIAAAFTAICAYYFGSSVGSKQKTEGLLRRLNGVPQ